MLKQAPHSRLVLSGLAVESANAGLPLLHDQFGTLRGKYDFESAVAVY